MPIQIGNSRLNSADETAQILGVKVGTVKKYVRDGILKGKRMGKDFWITGDSIDQLPQGYRNRKRPSRGAVQMFKPPPDGPFTAQAEFRPPDERLRILPSNGTSDWSFWDFAQEALISISIIACTLFAFVFSYEGAVLYLQNKQIHWILGVPIDLALGFALTISLAILAILFSLKEKNIYFGLPIYFVLCFLSVYSSFVFSYNESTNSARLSTVKEKAAKYLEAAKTTLSADVSLLAEQEQQIQGKMEMEERHGTGARKRGQGPVWQTLKNEKDLTEARLQGAQANLEIYDKLAQTYQEQSNGVTDPNLLKSQAYELSLQMPARAVNEKNSYSALFKSDEFEALPHQRAWQALFSSNRAERNQARFTFLYSGMFEFIAFTLALYRVSRRFRLEEKIDGIVTGATLWAAKLQSWERLDTEVEQHSKTIKEHRIKATEMLLQNKQDEGTLKHLDKHVRNSNKAKEILSRKQ